ncbi:MAG TPA: glycosyltransferase [Novosphingobium sp.]|nr:glycosyltransferase [Novosphingobium sp.]
MKRPRLVNLLDDFALGGVTRGLGIFDCDAVRAVVDPQVERIAKDAWLAPRLEAEVIIVHFPPNWRRLLFLASLRQRNPRARIIWVEHSYTRAWEALKVPEQGRFRLLLRATCRMVDHIVCVSHGQARWLAEAANLSPETVEVIHPWSRDQGLASLPYPAFAAGRPLRVGALGRFAEQKGFDTLISAHRRGLMPGTELVIGGTGPDEERLKLMAGDSPFIHFLGKITDVAGFLEQADVVALPSRWEAYGQVANEAREGGRPIITAPVDGLPEQVGEAGMVVDFTDDAAVLDTFARLRAADLPAMARAARQSTLGCGPLRQQQWAHLLDRALSHATRGHFGELALAL